MMNAGNPVRTGPAGLALIQRFEGLRCRRYQDVVGKWTIGYGHLILAGDCFVEPIPRGTALAWLRKDLQRTERGIRHLLLRPVTQNQFDALVAFAFNVGVGALSRSRLLRLINAGQPLAAADQFLVWNRAGGRVVEGLSRRRRAERALFLS